MARSAKVTVIDRLPQFKQLNKIVMEDALREGARDILIKSRTKAPFKTGDLRRDSYTRKVSTLKYRVSYWKEYAAYQERGMRKGGSHRVIHYTTAGTGKHFLRNAGNEVAKAMPRIYKKHAKRV